MHSPQGLTRAIRSASKHTHEDQLRELTQAMGAGTATVRQLSALNTVATELAPLRTERELQARVPEMLMRSLECSSARVTYPTAEGVLPDDATARTRRAFSDGRLSHGDAVRSGDHTVVEIAAPVRSGGGIAAVISGQMRMRGDALGDADIARVETFAAMVGLAIDNVRLYENLESKVEERTRHLRETQAALVQQEKMTAMATLVAGLAHELNTPLGSVIGSQQALGSVIQKLGRLEARDERERRLLATAASLGSTIGEGAQRVSGIVDAL